MADTVRAHDFIEGIGVNTHLNYTSTVYGNVAEVLKALRYTGIDEVRNIPPYDWNMAAFEPLLQAGIEFDFLYPGEEVNDIRGVLDRIAQVDAAYPGAVAAIEGLNEANNWPGDFGGDRSLAAQVAFQERLFDAVQAHPTLNDVPVYSMTLGAQTPEMQRSLGDLSDDADYGNTHAYFPSDSTPRKILDAIEPWTWVNTPGLPRVMTETGFSTLPQNSQFWDETTQAKYTLDLLMDLTADGISKVYLYELFDQNPDPSGSNPEDHFGLFRNDYSPKPVATAIRNLTQILGDDGADAGSFPVEGLPYTVTGLPASGDTVQFAKSDGSSVIAVWAEPRIWDPVARKAIAAPTVSTDVAFDRGYDTVRVYDPLVQADPIRTLHGVDRVTLGITDHPLLVEVVPGDAGSPPPTQTPAPSGGVATTIGTGPDELVLKLQQDEYQGSARYTVEIDGEQIGGVLTASATRASGESDTLTVRADLAAGDHRVEIDFLNDRWDGTPSTDRNLFVVGGTYNGEDIGFGTKSLLSAGPASIAFREEAAPSGSGKTTTIGTGPDAMVLYIQQDEYQGDAQYIVKIDGQRFGGVQTASATRASGEFDTVTVLGTIAEGTHTFEVQFLNDKWDGTAATDRNLYVAGATYNGAAVAGAKLSLYSGSSPSSFAFVDTV